MIDQGSKQVATEAIHIGINNPALNSSAGKMNISQIIKHLLGEDRSSNKSNEVVDLNLQEGHTYLTILNNRFFRVVCLTNKVA